MIGVIEDDNGRVILQLGMLRCTVSTIEFTLGAKVASLETHNFKIQKPLNGADES